MEIRPFGSVVGELLAVAGGRTLPLAQAGHIQAAVAEACLTLEEDSPFFRSINFAGTHRKIRRALSELRDWGLDADDLDELAEKLEEPLRGKVRSLGKIERAVSEALRSLARERAADRMAASLDLEPESTELRPLLVLAGSAVSYLEARWLNWVAARGVATTVLVEHSAKGSALFAELNPILPLLNGKLERRESDEPLLHNLFNTKDPTDEAATVQIEIVSTSDPLAEAEWTVRSILNDLRSGLGEHEIAIFCRNGEAYIPLLESAATRFELNLSTPRRLPLLANSFASLTLQILEFCAANDVRLLGAILNSSYLGLSPQTVAEMRKALAEFSRSPEKMWKLLEQYAVDQAEPVSWLKPLLEWRSNCLRESANLTEWCERFRGLGQQQWREQALDASSLTSQRDSYAQSALQRTLAEYASVERAGARRSYTLAQFSRFCRRLWEASEVSSPSRENAVPVVRSSEQLGAIKRLYVVGMLEGIFPRRRSEDPILSDEDKAVISRSMPDRPPIPNSYDKAASERDEFYRICASASEKLTFSYPQTDDDRDNVRAFYLVEVERAVSGRVAKIDRPRTLLTPPIPTIGADVRLENALAGPREAPLPNKLQSQSAVQAVAKQATGNLTPRQLSDVLECPYSFMARRVMDMRPNRSRSRWHNLYQLPKRTGLAGAPFQDAAEHALSKALNGLVEELYSDGSPHDIALIKSGGKRLISEWVEREFQSRELWPRETVVEEPSFEKGDLRSKLKADGGYVFLHGSYPAISERDGYRILHLFQASEPWEEANREEDPWFRLKKRDQFEIGLLLIALHAGGAEQVGIEIDSASGTRNLFLMPRPEGNFRSHQAAGFKITAIDRDRRAELFREIGKQVEIALKRISSADVEPRPGEHCRTCDYGELCRRSLDFGEEDGLDDRDYFE